MNLDLETVTWERAALLVVVCGLSSSAATEAFRQTLSAYLKFKGLDKRAWWRRGLLRTLAVVAGALSGYWLSGVHLGLILGAAGGGLSTSLVAGAKSIIRKKTKDG
jgi:uncharacterized membrane protein YfcA